MQAGLAAQQAVELSPQEDSFVEVLDRLAPHMPEDSAAALQVRMLCAIVHGSV